MVISSIAAAAPAAQGQADICGECEGWLMRGAFPLSSQR
jgi:hypothetical protein